MRQRALLGARRSRRSLVVWLFVLHRLAGPRIKWKVGLRWAAVAAVFAGSLLDRPGARTRGSWNVEGPKSGEQYFFPSLARTATGNFIPADTLLMTRRTARSATRTSTTAGSTSVHHFSSFNNPPYLFSVRETRKVALEARRQREGLALVRRLPRSGAVLQRRVRRPELRRRATTPTGQAGITCTVCHAITHVNSPRGNADYTIEEPIHYPFAFSDNAILQWINNQLVKAKPEFHKKTFLKPLHKTAEFCSHLPQGPPAGRSSTTTRIPARPEPLRHVPALAASPATACRASTTRPRRRRTAPAATCRCGASEDFGAKDFDGTGRAHGPRPPLPRGQHRASRRWSTCPTARSIEAHRKFNEGVMRVDLFGVREGGTIDGALHRAAAARRCRRCSRGQPYLVEAVDPHGEDRPPLHPGHGRLQRGLGRRRRSRAAIA